jgi:eukaryotic-like serine/threonine-protein kinase
LAFAGTNSDGTNSVWIRDMGSPDARPLAGTESGANLPFFWTTDSKFVVFQQNGVLKEIDVSSGVVHTLCDVSSAVIGGSSNGDGLIIFGLGDGGLMRISADGGPASPLTTLDSSRGEFQHVMPSFLPDGRHFLYLRVSSDLANSGIYVGSLDASPAKQDSRRLLATTLGVTYVPSSSDPNKGRLLFLTSDGTLMAQPFDARRFEFMGDPVPVEAHVGQYINGAEFSASANGVLVYRTAGASAESQPMWFDRQGKTVGTVGEPDVYYFPALSPDGTKVVVGRGLAEHQALWLFDSSQGTNTRFTFGSFSAASPIWSSDGKRIIFSSDPSGVWDLYQKPASGAADQDLLLKSDENKWPSDVSHDGRFLLYYALDPRTKTDVWVLPLQADRKPFSFLRGPSNELNAHFSPDGRWVAYESDESGRGEIYVRPFSPDSSAADASGTGAKWQVSYGGGALPLWSPDGKELYYLTPDGKVMVVSVTTSPTFQAGTPKFLFQAPPLAVVPALRTTGQYTLDGKRFLFISSTGQGSQAQDQAPFNVVLNWQAALKQQQ